VALDGQVTAIERVEKIEPDGERIAEPRMVFTQDLCSGKYHQTVEGYFQSDTIPFENQAVFRSNEFERPSVVGFFRTDLRDMLHEPLSAPRARRKPWARPEHRFRQRL